MLITDRRNLEAEFPLARRVRYLDVAYQNILPLSVAAAMERFVREELVGGGQPEEYKRCAQPPRELFARLIGADAAEVAFIKSTADGLNIAANALPFEVGDNVIINDLEHPSNYYPWLNLRRRGVEVRVVPNEGGRLPVDSLLEAADGRTRALAISAVQYRNGLRSDLAALAQFCRPNGVALVVDAIQALGTVDLDVRALGVDILSCGGHKGLLGPYGVGGLYVRRDLIPTLFPAYLGGEGVANWDGEGAPSLRDDAHRFEVGNYNYSGLIGLQAALELLLDVGMGAIERHVLDLNEPLVEAIRSRGLTLVSPFEPAERSSIVVFSLPDPERAAAFFEARDCRVSIRQGNIRVSTHLYNSRDDIDHFLADVDAYRASG
jgi:selenocysteine lyase/cysteine desulfurase